MEPSRSSEDFSRRITVADANNIVAVLDLSQDNSKYQIFSEDYIVEFQVAIEDLKITVSLPSLFPAPYPDVTPLMGESQVQAEIGRMQTEGQKVALGIYTAKGNGPWKYQSEVTLMNQGGAQHHVPILVPFLSSNETHLVGGSFKLGVKIEPQWNQPLKANDYLVVRGTYRQVVSFSSKKKDDGIDSANARIEALELALYGKLTDLPANSLLGRGSTAGVAGPITLPLPPSLGGLGVAPDPSALYGSIGIPATAKNGWAGIHFQGGQNKNYLMINPTTGDFGFYNSIVPRWNFYATDTGCTIGLPLQISTGSTISKVISLSTIISLPNIAAGALHQIDLTLTGALVGQYVSASPVINSVLNGFWTFSVHCQVLAPDIVSLFFKNDWYGALDLPDFWIRLLYVELL
jgi:hypothetical protein